MTDYSTLLDGITQQHLAVCSDSELYPRDAARLEIDEGKVSVRIHTYFTNSDAVPMRERHGLTLVVNIAANANIDALRETLADGGEASGLIDCVIAGHGSRWNGRDYVGALTDDARDALDDLIGALADLPTSGWAAMDVGDYLAPLGSDRAQLDGVGLTDTSGPDAISAAAAQAIGDALKNRCVLTGDVVRYLTKLVERVRDDADYLDA